MIKPFFVTIVCVTMAAKACGQHAVAEPARDTNDRLLVISGGGARGGWGVGVLDGISKTTTVRYSAAFGTSTGSLTIPLALLDDMPRLVASYTGIRQGDVFNVNPFKTDITNGTVTTDIKHVNAIWRLLICKRNSLGETNPLRKRIRDSFHRADYTRIRSSHKLLAVAVTNMTTGDVEIKTSDGFGYEDMCDWMWASANEPVWMSLVPKNGAYYSDGGVRNVIPLQQALETAYSRGYRRIDVIINNSKDFLEPWYDPASGNFSWLKTLERTLGIYDAGTIANNHSVGDLMNNLRNAELSFDSLQSQYRRLKDSCTRRHDEAVTAAAMDDSIPTVITFRYMPKELAATYPSELAFFPQYMKILLDAGRASVGHDTIHTVRFRVLNTEKLRQSLQ